MCGKRTLQILTGQSIYTHLMLFWLLAIELIHKEASLSGDGRLVLSNNALVAITLLIAESNPDEMDIIVNAVGHMLSE